MTDIILKHADCGKEAFVKIGDLVTIELDENPTTGFRWEVETSAPRAIGKIQSQFVIGQQVANGGGGRRLFKFKVKHRGSASVELLLMRKWEGPESVIDRCVFDLNCG